MCRSFAFALSVLVLATTATAQVFADKLRALVVTGANNHDWEFTAPELEKMLEESGRFEVDITRTPSETLGDAEGLRKYDVFVLDYNGPRWGEQAEANFLAAVEMGTGVAVIHAANNPFEGWVDYEEMVALCWREGTSHGRFHSFDVTVTDTDHPITNKMLDLRAHPDELYHGLVHMHGAEHRVLATAFSSKDSNGSGGHEPMIIVRDYGKGRVFHTPLGHVWRNQPQTRASVLDPQFRWLVARGAEWAATGEVNLPVLPPMHLSVEDRQRGFRLLFDGTKSGWRGYRQEGFPDKGWEIEHGCLVHRGGGGGGDLITEAQFENFEFRFEWAVAPGANSGVIYKCTEEQGASWQTGPEFQVYDDVAHSPDPLHSAGALYALAKPNQNKALKPAGHFNTSRIVVFENRVEHWLNGQPIVTFEFEGDRWESALAASKFAEMPGFGRSIRGHIALQDHGDEVWFRRMLIRELEPKPVKARGGR